METCHPCTTQTTVSFSFGSTTLWEHVSLYTCHMTRMRNSFPVKSTGCFGEHQNALFRIDTMKIHTKKIKSLFMSKIYWNTCIRKHFTVCHVLLTGQLTFDAAFPSLKPLSFCTFPIYSLFTRIRLTRRENELFPYWEASIGVDEKLLLLSQHGLPAWGCLLLCGFR